LDELAHHFTRSGNAVKAVEYLHRAGVQAATRSSHQDACRHLRQALSMLATLPESRERHAREIKLQFALGESLLMGRGITHPEIEPVSERLRVLCEAVGDHVQLGVALIMLATYYRNLGQLARAASLAERVLEIAGKANAGALAWSAHMQLTMVESSRGNFAASLAHQERAVAAYDPARHGTAGKWGPDNVGTDASVLWALGYPTRALQRARQAVAGTLTPWLRCEALFNETCLHWLRRDAASQREAAQQLIALSEAQGFPFWLAAGKLLHAASLATSGAATATVAEISDHIARVSARFNPPELALIAELQHLGGQHAEALTTVEKALAVSARTGVHSSDAELHRLKGEALLARQTEGPRFKVEGAHPTTDAAECFRRALEIARGQEARSVELRAATSLARLLRTQGKNAEARELLAPIYDWFTEGFDTGDLIDAKALLEELR